MAKLNPASIAAYSAMSWPVSSVQSLSGTSVIGIPVKTGESFSLQNALPQSVGLSRCLATQANATRSPDLFLGFLLELPQVPNGALRVFELHQFLVVSTTIGAYF
jgi:hypothetical protein